MDSMLAFLKKESPDVLFLQEMYDEPDLSLPLQYRSYSYLKQELGYDYGHFASAMRTESPVGAVTEGNVIFSKFPIEQVNKTYFVEPDDREYYREHLDDWPLYPRILQQAELRTPSGIINAINVQGPWDLDGDHYGHARKLMERAILEAIEGKSKVIVAGDLNAKPTNPAMQAIEKSLKNVFGHGLKSTFNMRRKTNPGYATAVVDLVYVTPDINVLDKECPDVDISDHLPLIVEMEIK